MAHRLPLSHSSIELGSNNGVLPKKNVLITWGEGVHSCPWRMLCDFCLKSNFAMNLSSLLSFGWLLETYITTCFWTSTSLPLNAAGLWVRFIVQGPWSTQASERRGCRWSSCTNSSMHILAASKLLVLIIHLPVAIIWLCITWNDLQCLRELLWSSLRRWAYSKGWDCTFGAENRLVWKACENWK